MHFSCVNRINFSLFLPRGKERDRAEIERFQSRVVRKQSPVKSAAVLDYR